MKERRDRGDESDTDDFPELGFFDDYDDLPEVSIASTVYVSHTYMC